MTLSNTEYLKAYNIWKDQVNTEDIDTPERFEVHVQNLENAEVLEETRETFSFVMDSLSGGGQMDAATIRAVFIPVAEALGLDTTWWKPAAKAITDGQE